MENKLEKHINNSPLVQAAIIEAVHRFYYDRVLSDDKNELKELEETNTSNILSTLWNLMPDWRYILYKITKRYNPASQKIDSLPLYSKPKKPVNLPFNIEIKIK